MQSGLVSSKGSTHLMTKEEYQEAIGKAKKFYVMHADTVMNTDKESAEKLLGLMHKPEDRIIAVFYNECLYIG